MSEISNFVFNIAKGRAAELYRRVQGNDPSASTLVIAIFNISTGPTAADAGLIDCATFAAVEALANVNEVTNSGYLRKELADVDLVSATVDNTNDRADLDIPDQTWTAVVAGDAWTKLVIGYAFDGGETAGNNANIVPITAHDFVVTPDGSDITAVINAAGFYRAQ